MFNNYKYTIKIYIKFSPGEFLHALLEPNSFGERKTFRRRTGACIRGLALCQHVR